MFSAFNTFGKLGALASSVARAWSPLALWPNGIATPGMWISPRDLTSQWADYTGTTPVSVPGTVADSANPVGLALDIRAGAPGVLGPELVTNGDFSAGTTGWTPDIQQGVDTVLTADTSIFPDGGMKISAPVYPGAGQTISGLVVGTLYEVAASIYSDSLRASIIVGDNYAYNSVSQINEVNDLTLRFVAAATSVVVWVAKVIPLVGWASGDLYVDNISVREVPGSHMLQSTSAARPLLSARVNLLTKTEDFADAVWAAENTTVNPTNKQSVKETATNTNHTVYYAAPILSGYSAGSKVSFQFAAKPEGQNYVTGVLLQSSGIWASVTVDLSTSTITQQLVAGGFAIESATATAGTGNLAGYTILEFVVTSSNTSSMDFPSICLSDSGTFTPVTYGRNTYMGDPLKGVRVAYAQVANGGGASYQRVTTASDYTATGFPIAQLYDGVDDSMATAAFSAGTLTSSMDCMIAVRRDSAALVIAGLYETAGSGTRYTGYAESGASGLCFAGAGAPTVWVDDVQLSGGTSVTAGTLHTALTVGDWHILEFRNLDLSAWTAAAFGRYTGGIFNGPRGDILLYPSTASTTDKDAARQLLADYYGVTLP